MFLIVNRLSDVASGQMGEKKNSESDKCFRGVYFPQKMPIAEETPVHTSLPIKHLSI